MVSDLQTKIEFLDLFNDFFSCFIDSQPEKLDFRINNNDDKLKTNDRINGYGGGDDNDRNDDEDFDILLRSAAEAFKYFQQHQQQQQQQKQKQQKT